MIGLFSFKFEKTEVSVLVNKITGIEKTDSGCKIYLTGEEAFYCTEKYESICNRLDCLYVEQIGCFDSRVVIAKELKRLTSDFNDLYIHYMADEIYSSIMTSTKAKMNVE